MDKTEYHIKLEELNRLVDAQDYEGALAIADSIDWRKVKSVRTLCMVADVYEVNENLEKSMQMLEYARKRSSVGKMILYRQVELALKLGRNEDAVDYYNQYLEIAPNDTSKYILKYKIYKAQKAPLEEQIAILEEYRDKEYTERWVYELARLYKKAGKQNQCVEACDDLILWFGEGKYVAKAMELKMTYQPLTADQKAKYDEWQKKNESPAADVQTEGEAAPAGISAAAMANLQRASEDKPNADWKLPGMEEAAAAEDDMEAIKLPEPEEELIHVDTEQLQERLSKSFQEILSGFNRTRINNAFEALGRSTGSEIPEELTQEEDIEDYHVTDLEPELVNEGMIPADRGAAIAHRTVAEPKEPVVEEKTEKPEDKEVVSVKEMDLEALFAETSGIFAAEAGGNPEPELEELVEEPKTETEEEAETETEAEVPVEEAKIETEAEAPAEEAETETEAEVPVEEAKIEIEAEVPAEEAETETEAEVPAGEPKTEIEAEAPAEEEIEIEAEAPAEEAETEIEAEVSDAEPEIRKASAEEVVEESDELLANADAAMAAFEASLHLDDIAADSAAAASEEVEEEEPAEEAEAETEADEPEEEAEAETEVDEPAEEKAEEIREPEDLGQTREFNLEEELRAALTGEDDNDTSGEEELDLSVLEAALNSEEEEPQAQQEEVITEVPAAEEEPAVEEAVAEEPTPVEAGDFLPDLDLDLVKELQEEQKDSLDAQTEEAPEAVEEKDMETDTVQQMLEEAAAEPEITPEALERETPEERRMRILNRKRPEKLTAEQKQLFTYFAKIPGMDEQIQEAITGAYEHADEKTSHRGNIAIMGSHGTGKSRLSEGLVKAICKEFGMEAAKYAVLDASDMNRKDPAAVVSKMSGGFLLIERASYMTAETLEKLSQAMDFRTDSLIVIIEDDKANMRRMLADHPEFAEKFASVISIPVFTNDELVTFARTYAKENGYRLDELGVLALYTKIGDNQREDEPVTVGKVKEMVDGAIRKASGVRLGRKISKRHSDADGRIILHEKDFDV